MVLGFKSEDKIPDISVVYRGIKHSSPILKNIKISFSSCAKDDHYTKNELLSTSVLLKKLLRVLETNLFSCLDFLLSSISLPSHFPLLNPLGIL